MTQDILGGGTMRFNIGQVISTSSAGFLRNFVPFMVITVIVGIPYILISLLGAGNMDAAEIERTGQLPSGFWGMLLISMLIFILTYALTQSAIIYGTVQDLRGQRASFGDCLSRGLSALPRVVFAAILASIAVAIGSMLLLIPGIILLIMWWVLVPAIVVEGANVGAGFGRSRELTRGHRWGILGILILVAVAQWVVSFLIGLVALALGGTVVEIVNLALMLVFTAFACVLSAVGYYYLRAEKEGIIIDDIARVFD
jgi:MFS family permease